MLFGRAGCGKTNGKRDSELGNGFGGLKWVEVGLKFPNEGNRKKYKSFIFVETH